MTSFDSISFLELNTGDGYHAWSKAGQTATKKIPGSNDNVIQKIGVGLPRLSLSVQMTAAQLTSMYTKRGAEGSLVFTFETVTAELESIDTPVRASLNADLYETRLNFIRSSGAISSIATTAILTEAGETILTEAGESFIQE